MKRRVNANNSSSSSSNNNNNVNKSSPLSSTQLAEVRDSVFRILSFLKTHPKESFSLQDIQQETGVVAVEGNLEDVVIMGDDTMKVNVAVFEGLVRNPLVKSDDSGVGQRFRYEHELGNVTDIRAFVEGKGGGVSREDLLEHNDGREWAWKCAKVVHDAGVIAIKQHERNRVVMFPRGAEFLVPLSCTVSGEAGDVYLKTDVDVRAEVQRGDVIILPGRPRHTYRVSAELGSDFTRRNSSGGNGMKPIGPAEWLATDKWLKTNSTPYSSSSIRPIRPPRPPQAFALEFDAKRIPIHPPLQFKTAGVVPLKQGCTNDVRDAWHDISKMATNNFKVNEGDKRNLDEKLLKLTNVDEQLLKALNRGDIERGERVREMKERRASQPAVKRRRAMEVRVSTNAHMLGK